MGYAIEISFNISGITSWENYLAERKTDANSMECSTQYFLNEIEGNRQTIYRNEHIHVVLFDAEKFDKLIEYIKYTRLNKKNYIECIYTDHGPTEILYASPKYIKKMDKNDAKFVKRRIKNKIINSEAEEKILDVMRKTK
tara:strand:- start:252 stop:671 length:420 start_codon:yes stop_codon:yes gene_type:complete